MSSSFTPLPPRSAEKKVALPPPSSKGGFTPLPPRVSGQPKLPVSGARQFLPLPPRAGTKLPSLEEAKQAVPEELPLPVPGVSQLPPAPEAKALVPFTGEKKFQLPALEENPSEASTSSGNLLRRALEAARRGNNILIVSTYSSGQPIQGATALPANAIRLSANPSSPYHTIVFTWKLGEPIPQGAKEFLRQLGMAQRDASRYLQNLLVPFLPMPLPLPIQ